MAPGPCQLEMAKPSIPYVSSSVRCNRTTPFSACHVRAHLPEAARILLQMATTCHASSADSDRIRPRAPASRPAPGDLLPVHSPLWHSRSRALRQPNLTLRFTRTLASSTQPVRITVLRLGLRCSKLRTRIGSSSTGSTPGCPRAPAWYQTDMMFDSFHYK